MDYYHKEEFNERTNPRFIWIWIRMIWYYLQIHSYVLTFIAQVFLMIQYSLLLILTISILINTFNTTYARQNISEEIYSMFSNLTPGYLGIKNFSSEHLGEFSISSMSKINASNSSIMSIHWFGQSWMSQKVFKTLKNMYSSLSWLWFSKYFFVDYLHTFNHHQTRKIPISLL